MLRPLDIAAQPVERIGHPRQHLPPRAAEGELQILAKHHLVHPVSSSTHVSLLPPPWELFTTRLPFRSATRVNPPGITTTFCPHRMYGRRSTRRPSKCSSTRLGCWLSSTTGWAMKLRGSFSIMAANISRSAADA